MTQFDIREWPTCCSQPPTLPTSDGRSEVRCAREERRRSSSKRYAASEFGIASIAGVARKFGVHRRLVREAIGTAVPQQRPAAERPRPPIEPVAEFIDGILEADRRAPRKQRHTTRRIWVRITKERPGYEIAESTVRQYVRLRKQALGLRVGPEPCVPQPWPAPTSTTLWCAESRSLPKPCHHRVPSA